MSSHIAGSEGHDVFRSPTWISTVATPVYPPTNYKQRRLIPKSSLIFTVICFLDAGHSSGMRRSKAVLRSVSLLVTDTEYILNYGFPTFVSSFESNPFSSLVPLLVESYFLSSFFFSAIHFFPSYYLDRPLE